jgi:hypothetical protein
LISRSLIGPSRALFTRDRLPPNDGPPAAQAAGKRTGERRDPGRMGDAVPMRLITTAYSRKW